MKQLESFGIPVYAVDPRNLESAVNTVLEAGQLLNATSKAQRLANEMRARIERVKERIAETVRARGFFSRSAPPLSFQPGQHHYS